MANSSDVAQNPNGNTIIVAIIVPACFVVLLVTLFILHRHRTYLLPELNHDADAAREERMRKRREELESKIKTQHFYDWLTVQKEKHPDSHMTTDPVCAICLDEFDKDAQIRGLRCSHIFHTQCLDEWFGRCNEFCPLCHRAIIPGARPMRGRMMEQPRPLPVAFMV